MNKFLMVGVVLIILLMTVLSTALVLFPDIVNDTIGYLLGWSN